MCSDRYQSYIVCALKDKSCLDCVYSVIMEYVYCKIEGFGKDLFCVVHQTVVCSVYL